MEISSKITLGFQKEISSGSTPTTMTPRKVPFISIKGASNRNLTSRGDSLEDRMRLTPSTTLTASYSSRRSSPSSPSSSNKRNNQSSASTSIIFDVTGNRRLGSSQRQFPRVSPESVHANAPHFISSLFVVPNKTEKHSSSSNHEIGPTTTPSRVTMTPSNRNSLVKNKFSSYLHPTKVNAPVSGIYSQPAVNFTDNDRTLSGSLPANNATLSSIYLEYKPTTPSRHTTKAYNKNSGPKHLNKTIRHEKAHVKPLAAAASVDRKRKDGGSGGGGGHRNGVSKHGHKISVAMATKRPNGQSRHPSEVGNVQKAAQPLSFLGGSFRSPFSVLNGFSSSSLHHRAPSHAVHSFVGSSFYPRTIFDPSSPTNVSAQLGSSAYLPCKIRNLGNKTVSLLLVLKADRKFLLMLVIFSSINPLMHSL